MSVKHFCDSCGNEIVADNQQGKVADDCGRLKTRDAYQSRKLPLVEVLVGAPGGHWNAGDYCKYCVIAAVNEFDDRPRMA